MGGQAVGEDGSRKYCTAKIGGNMDCTIEECLLYYSIGLMTVIRNGEVKGFKTEQKEKENKK